MDSFGMNKMLGALLGAVFIVFSISLLSDTIFYSPAPAIPGYSIEVPEDVAAAPEDVDEGPGILALIADADPAAGEAVFRRCVSCHTIEEGGPNRVGPNLWDTVETPIANAEGFSYSAAMREFAAAEEIWTYEHLAAFFENPRGHVPGTTMAFAGLRDVQDKANLIAYMRSFSNDPAPLPEIAALDEDVATEAEPVEPTPDDDGTAVSPETDAGTPATSEVEEEGDAVSPETNAGSPATTEGEDDGATVAPEAEADTDAAAPTATEADDDGAAVEPEQAEVDVAAGQSVFRRCAACHTVDEGGANRVGPNLWDIVDRPVAAIDGFNYSAAMREFAEGGTVWDEEHLTAFLANPRGYIPGTTMAFPGIRTAQEEANLIGYLRTLSDAAE